jgi:hypothetical protein
MSDQKARLAPTARVVNAPVPAASPIGGPASSFAPSLEQGTPAPSAPVAQHSARQVLARQFHPLAVLTECTACRSLIPVKASICAECHSPVPIDAVPLPQSVLTMAERALRYEARALTIKLVAGRVSATAAAIGVAAMSTVIAELIGGRPDFSPSLLVATVVATVLFSAVSALLRRESKKPD